MSDYWDTPAAQHDSGVHVNCNPAADNRRTVGGTGTAAQCMVVREHGPCVERFHFHDFNGPLVCGCSLYD